MPSSSTSVARPQDLEPGDFKRNTGSKRCISWLLWLYKMYHGEVTHFIYKAILLKLVSDYYTHYMILLAWVVQLVPHVAQSQVTWSKLINFQRF